MKSTLRCVIHSRIDRGTQRRWYLIVQPWSLPTFWTWPSGNGVVGPAEYQSLNPSVFSYVMWFSRAGSTPTMNVEGWAM